MNNPLPIKKSNIAKVAFIYTELQLSILKSINGKNISDFKILHPLHQASLIDGESNRFLIRASDQKLTIKSAKKLKSEVWSLIEKFAGEEKFELWIASCDNPIGQLLIHHRNCYRTILLEDGIGSYIPHSPFDIDRGPRFTLRKIKNFLYLFPHYRSVYGIGSHCADEYWALHPSAFPRASVRPKIIPRQNIVDAFDKRLSIETPQKAAIFLDQPLIKNSLISRANFEYNLNLYITRNSEKIKHYYIKKHPVTPDADLEFTIDIFKNSTEAEITIIDEATPIESLALSEKFNPTEIFSFYSSALYTLKILRPDIRIISIAPSPSGIGSRSLKKYIRAMQTIGVNYG